MVAIAQSNPYQILSRKIGYSVGLENLLRNATELVAIYADESKREVRLVDWQTLVAEKFKRPPSNDKTGKKIAPYGHIAHFFSTLHLIKIIGNELHVLYGLDSLSILRRYFASDDKKYHAALEYLLLLHLIEADGDIFLNCLCGKFDREKVRELLVEMIEEKWAVLRRKFVNRDLQGKVWDLLSINSTRTDARLDSYEKGPSPFAKRNSPLSSAPRQTRDIKAERVAEVPDSYLDKVLPTRKGWAKDFGLFGDSELTPHGVNLLDQLRAIGLASELGVARFWPYVDELAPLRISYEELNAKPVNSWDLVRAVFMARGGVTSSLGPTIEEGDYLVVLMRRIYDLYKSGSLSRGSIRHQIPLYILKPVLAAICLAENKPLPNIPKAIECETKGVKRRFDLISIRGTEGALVFRSIQS